MLRHCAQTVIFVAVLTIPCLKSNAEESSIRLGAMFHLTGDWAMEGAAFREGAELAADEINRHGGIRAKPIEMVFEDTAYVSKNCLTISKKFVEDKSIKGVLITTLHETKPSGPIFELAGLPAIVLWDAAPELEELGDFIFAIGPWAPDTGRKAADFAHRKLNARRAVILSTNHDWSLAVGASFAKEWQRSGGEVIQSITVNPGDSDFRTILLKIGKVDPDVLYAPLVDNIVPFVKQLRVSQFSKPIIMADNITEILLPQAAAEFEGIYQTMVADPVSEEGEAFRGAYKEKYKREPKLAIFSAWSYDAVKMFAWAIEQGASTRSEIKDWLYSIKDFKGVSGTLTMNSRGSAAKYVSMFVVKNAKLELIEQPDFAN
jgi:branched-chain amino acid transport system substrate-binding protein